MVLQSIRERLTGILAFAILGILIIPFALVGVTEYFTSSSGNIVARINDTEITTNDFNQSFSDFRRRMQSILGESYDPLQYDQLMVRRQHLDSLIEQELISQAAISMGLDVDDETLAEEIRNIPAFQVDGVFNADVYQSRLQSQGMSPKMFQNEMRAQYVVSQLPVSIGASSIATPAELNEFIALADQSRTFASIMVPTVKPEVAVEFEESQIAEWYESNTDQYQSEEQVIIEYVELDAALLDAGPAPDEDVLREQFESQKGRFISPEQRKVSHILLTVAADASDAEKETVRQTADDISKRVQGGEDFAALAAEFSDDQGSASSGGDLGWVEAGVMVQAFENAMYELTLDAPVSGPVETGFGWHVIQLTELRESTGMAYEEARMTLVREYEEEVSARAFLEQADRLVDIVYEDPTTLESAALVMGLDVKELGPFTRAGGEGMAANPDVVDAAFSDLVLLQGSVSDPVDLDENRLIMVKLKEHFPVALKPVEDVRDEIVATLAKNLETEEANAKAEMILAALNSGEGDLVNLAGQYELEHNLQEAAKRNSAQPDAIVVQEVFRIKAPEGDEAVKAVLPATDGFAVVELTSVADGAIDSEAMFAMQQYDRAIANSHASQETAALLSQLRASADIEVFEDKIQ